MGQEKDPQLPPIEPLFPPKETDVLRARGKPKKLPQEVNDPRDITERTADEVFGGTDVPDYDPNG